MKDLFRIISHSFQKNKKQSVSVLAVIITFVMVYSLIMPAVAIERDAAEKEPGLTIEESASENVAAEAMAEAEPASLEAEGSDEAAAVEEAVAEEPAAEEIEAEAAVPAAAPAQSAADDSNVAADTSAAQQGANGGAAQQDASVGAAQQGANGGAAQADENKANADSKADPSDSDTNTSDAEEEMPAQNFEQVIKYKEIIDEDGNTVEKQIKVVVDAAKDTFPAGTTMKAELILNNADVEKAVEDAVKQAAGELADATSIVQYRAVDITFADKDGQKIEPAKEVEVRITSDKIAEIVNPMLVHVNVNVQNGRVINADVFPKNDVSIIDEKPDTIDDNENTMLFKASRFSPYVIVESQTIDEEGDAMHGLNGVEENADKGAETDTAGDGVLIAESDNYTVTIKFNEDANIPEDAEVEINEIPEASRQYQSYMGEAEKLLTGDENASTAINYAKIVDVNIVSATEGTVTPDADVDVDIAYKETDEIAEGTVMQALSFNGRTPAVEKDALVYGGETYVDGMQVTTNKLPAYAIVGTETIEDTFLTADGQTYKITVTYGPEAEIPSGSKLRVEEILPGTEEYDSYNEQAVKELSPEVGAKGYSSPICEDEDSFEAHIVSLPEETEVGFARYFDISIIYNGEEIEPKAAVEVRIEYVEPIDLAAGEELQIVHFADDGIEVISPKVNGNEIVFEQESFSVTATVTTTTSNNGQYALLVQYDGKYYEVLFDGTLEEVTPSGTNSFTVSTAERWTWNRQGNYGSNYRIRVQTNTGYEYIDPAASSGISTTARTITRTQSGNGYYISGGGAYLGVTTDAEGNPVLTGNISGQGNASVFYFATLASSVTGLTVDHIDIGVRGSAKVSVPLAYGTYYYANGSEAMTVQVGEHVNANGVNTAVPVTEADLMSATISAYTKDGAGNRTYDNSFIISQYTSSTGSGQAMDQVRVGGTFPIGSVTLSQRAYRGDVEQYITSDNQIFYEVDVTKPVELTLQDSEGNTLYQRDGSGNLVPLTVTVNVTLTSNFSYWDDDNECPGISYFGRNNNGTANLNGSNASGMDFVLGTSDEADATLAAIEIIKYTVNTDGQLISVRSGGTFNFDIYQNMDGDVTAPTAWSGETTAAVDYSGYTKVSSRSITAGEAGYGVSYDYSVDRGLVYIQETGNLDGTTITDTDGNTWDYVDTYIQTEYVWRDDDGVTHSNVNQTDKMRAIPDVVGDYYSTTYEGELHNTFLEFYVYNVYKGGEVEFKKVDQSGYMIEDATFELYLTDPSVDSSAITVYRATSARNEETGLVEVDFGSVAYGTYYMIETDAPEGYVKDTNVYRVEVFEGESGNESCKIERKTDDGWVELSKQNDLYVFPNTPKYVNDFNITKIDENGSQVAGATLKFERLVTTESGDQYVDYDFDTSMSGNQSTITVGSQDVSLGTGKYRISETGIPVGYEGTFEYIYLTVNGENATITLTDASGNAIGGVVDPDDTTKTTYTITNDDGLSIINMEETTTTTEDDDGTTITSHSYKLQVANKSTSREVKILKVDNSETPVPLKDAKFTMVIDDVTYVFTSNENGYLEFSGKIVDGTEVPLTDEDPSGVLESLQTGNYVLTETDPPAGYIMLEGRISISIGSTVTADKGKVKAYDANDNEIAEDDTETEVAYYVISIANTPGQALPNTGGSGTLPYTLGGIALIMASALMYGFRMRRRERRLN